MVERKSDPLIQQYWALPWAIPVGAEKICFFVPFVFFVANFPWLRLCRSALDYQASYPFSVVRNNPKSVFVAKSHGDRVFRFGLESLAPRDQEPNIT